MRKTNPATGCRLNRGSSVVYPTVNSLTAGLRFIKPMPKDVRNQQKVNKRLVLAAINALKKKGWDINPYTVADEAQVARSLVYRCPEVMDLVAQARASSYDDPKARIAFLEDHICELQETIRRLEEQNHVLAEKQEKQQISDDNSFVEDKGQQANSQTPPTEKVGSVPESHQEAVHWQDKSSGQSESEIYNAFRSGHVYSSKLLSDLSWKDLEAVYNFSGGLLKDYATHVSFMADETVEPKQVRSSEVTAKEEIPTKSDTSQDFADPIGQVGQVGQAEDGPDAKNEWCPAGSQRKVDSYEQGVFSAEEDPRARAAHVLAEAQSFAEAGVKALAEAEARVRAKAQDQAPREDQGKEEAHSEIPGYSQLQESLEPDDSSMRFGDAASQRSSEVGSEANAEALDLDKLDIFEGLENVDLKGIEVIEDVDFEQANSPSVSGDELRQLLKNRIKQASELPEQPLREPLPPTKQSEPGRLMSRSKFVGTAKAPQEPPSHGFIVRQVPPDIRKACLILGVRPEKLTQKIVLEAWKRQIATPGVHPDLGGDTEAAVFLNTAKDQLIRWLDARAPKLGKKFGSYKASPQQSPSQQSTD